MLKRKYLDFVLMVLRKLNSSSMCSKTSTQRSKSDSIVGILLSSYVKLSEFRSFLKLLAISMACGEISKPKYLLLSFWRCLEKLYKTSPDPQPTSLIICISLISYFLYKSKSCLAFQGESSLSKVGFE